jgi:hypothetical protein
MQAQLEDAEQVRCAHRRCAHRRRAGSPVTLFDASFFFFGFSPQAHMTRAQSLTAIQTVLSASFGCIMYLRYGSG